MDSIGQLSSSLPPDYEDKQLQASFRQAALSITALFKQGKRATSKAYIAGQRQALQEVLEFLQALLDQPAPQQSTSAAPSAGAGPVDVGRLINFICARQEALKAEEEDHDEDDSAAAGPPPAAPPVRRSASAAPAPASPLRPGVAFRSASSTGVPPRPASAQATSSRLPRETIATTSSAPASPPSSHFSPPYTRPSTSSSASAQPLFASTSSFTTSSSSAPASAAGLVAPASPSPLAPHTHAHAYLAAPASPLSRAAGRTLRPRGNSARDRDRDRAGSKPASGAATPTASGGGSAGAQDGAGGMGEEYGFEVGMKRRWPGSGAAEVVELSPPRIAHAHAPGDVVGMEVEGMEGWDGVGERPLKRVARRDGRSVGGGGDGAEGGEGGEGQAQR